MGEVVTPGGPERDWDPLHAEAFKDAHQTYQELRERCPVARTDRWGGFWTLTRYADITAAASDARTFSSAVQNLVPSSARNGLPRKPLMSDPPEHTHYRRVMNPFYEEGAVAFLEPFIRRRSAHHLDPIIARGRGELVDEFTQFLPLEVLCHYMGLPEAEARAIQELSARYVPAVAANDQATVRTASAALDDYARRHVARRKASPREPKEDITSGLLALRIDGEPLSDEFVAGAVRLMIVGGDRAVGNAIASSAMHLARDRTLADRLRREPQRIADAVEEFVRLYSPSQLLARTTTREVEIGGKRLGAGDVVALQYMAGNRDPEAFPNPDEVDLDRPNKHLGFGHGVHKCVARDLARLQVRVAVSELLRRTRDFAIDGAFEFNTWPEYGPKTLPLRFTPA